MITEMELKHILKDNGFCPVRYINNGITDNLFLLDIPFEDFIEFIKLKKADAVYYKYFFYESKDYLITDETTEAVDIELTKDLKKKIEKYNKDILNMPFDKPYRLNILIISDKIGYAIAFEERWLEDDEKIFEPEIALISICNPSDEDDPDEIYNNYLNGAAEKRLELLSESKRKLVEHLLNDNKFKMCTNQSLRHSYAENLSQNNPDLVIAFYGKNGYYEKHTVCSVLEIVYKCMKSGMTSVDEVFEMIL